MQGREEGIPKQSSGDYGVYCASTPGPAVCIRVRVKSSGVTPAAMKASAQAISGSVNGESGSGGQSAVSRPAVSPRASGMSGSMPTRSKTRPYGGVTSERTRVSEPPVAFTL